MCVTQPGSISDETAHIQTAYRYANVLLFAIIGLIPACIQAAGCVSYDAPMIGLTALLTAYLLRLLYTDEPIIWREWATCAGGCVSLDNEQSVLTED